MFFRSLFGSKKFECESAFNKGKWQLKSLPNEILIETVMGCNLKCPMCPVPDAKKLMNNRRPCHMKPPVFKKILDQISDRSRFISLYQMGEPLLNKYIFDYIKLCKSKGHQVSLTSNGTLLTKESSEQLIKTGLDKITFSVDGFNAETYEQIRIGANHKNVVTNIETLYRLARRMKSRLIIQIDCIDSDLTNNEIPDMIKFWKSRSDIFNVIPLDDWADQMVLPEKMGDKKSPAANYHSNRYPCDLLWNTLAISAEGKVMYCCHDFKLLSGLPNVMDIPLKKIWQEIMQDERKKHVTQTIDSAPCLMCSAWKSRHKKVPFSDILKKSFSLYEQTKIKKILRFFR